MHPLAISEQPTDLNNVHLLRTAARKTELDLGFDGGLIDGFAVVDKGGTCATASGRKCARNGVFDALNNGGSVSRNVKFNLVSGRGSTMARFCRVRRCANSDVSTGVTYFPQPFEPTMIVIGQ